MARFWAVALALVLALAPACAGAGGRGSRSHSSSHTSSTSSSTHRTSHAASGHHTSSSSHRSPTHHSKTKRDPKQRAEFMKSHPCPSTGKTSGACPGYIVDHVVPLKRGGRDEPSNMQWQAVEAAKAKDKWE